MFAFSAPLFNRKVIYAVGRPRLPEELEDGPELSYGSARKQEDKEDDESSPTVSECKTADCII